MCVLGYMCNTASAIASHVPCQSTDPHHVGGRGGRHSLEAGAGEHQRCQGRWSTRDERCRGASGWWIQRTGARLAACRRAGGFGLWTGIQVRVLLAACLWLPAACHGLRQAQEPEGLEAALCSAWQRVIAHLQARWRHRFARALAGLPAQACRCSYRGPASARRAGCCGRGVAVSSGAAQRVIAWCNLVF